MKTYKVQVKGGRFNAIVAEVRVEAKDEISALKLVDREISNIKPKEVGESTYSAFKAIELR